MFSRKFTLKKLKLKCVHTRRLSLITHNTKYLINRIINKIQLAIIGKIQKNLK